MYRNNVIPEIIPEMLGVLGVIDPRIKIAKVHPKYVKCWGVQIKNTRILIFIRRCLLTTCRTEKGVSVTETAYLNFGLQYAKRSLMS